MKAYVYVTEFQKRGLPHNHCSFFLKDKDKITTGEQLDNIIWAEIPDKNIHPELYEIVVEKMLHGPCTRNSPCMQKDGIKCSKGFPKRFAQESIVSDNRFPIYRRRNDGRGIFKNGVWLDNRYVVPYNPVLLLLYNNHLNCELIQSSNSMAYQFKYTFKGVDRAKVKIGRNYEDAADMYDETAANNNDVDPNIEATAAAALPENEEPEQVEPPVWHEPDKYFRKLCFFFFFLIHL